MQYTMNFLSLSVSMACLKLRDEDVMAMQTGEVIQKVTAACTCF